MNLPSTPFSMNAVYILNRGWGSGSVCFWASWIQIRILPSTSTKRKKKLDFYYFVIFYWPLYLKTDVLYMYLQKVISKQTSKKHIFSWHLVSQWQKNRSGSGQWYGSANPDPNPYENVTDPEHLPWSMKLYPTFMLSEPFRSSVYNLPTYPMVNLFH